MKISKPNFEAWQINLMVLWVGQFLVNAGMTMIVPFIALYLSQDIGVQGEHRVALWAGFIFAANFVTSFIFQPLWGKLSDQYGRKVMLLRSGFGMAIVFTAMGFATQAWHLLALRLINGTISGFNPAATSLISSNTPKEKMGFAMGISQSGTVAGTILGPLIGGILADTIGFRYIFYITGSCIFLATLLALFSVREKFDRSAAAQMPKTSVLSGLRELSLTPQLPALFTVTLLLQFALISPMTLLPLYVQKLQGTTENLAFWSGLVSAVTGLSNMLMAPILGKASDKYGAHRILTFSLIGAGLMLIPQAFVQNVEQLIIVRFLMGLCMGGLLPSVNSLIRYYTPDGMESRAFGFNSSTNALGNMTGSVMGGVLAGFIGVEGLFVLSGILLMLNMLWVRARLYSKPTADRHRKSA
ncbi:MFS transporter [Paenibacillus sp. WLX2291]|uniref:MFS transporter n=1 Tax=Paenibacillus sp. WLX2291 TaxID=3296934 RepID=UPI0039841A9D